MNVLLFDIDGTLIQTGGAGGAALMAAFREEFGVADPQDVAFSGRTDRGIARELFELHGFEDTDANWRRLRDGYLERLQGQLPRHAGRVLPGVVGLLESLSRRTDVALGLLTGNVRHGARLKLEHYALYHHFAFGGFGDEHPHRDDVAHEALRATRAHLLQDFVEDRVWVIGDTPMDVRCGRAIGAKVLAVTTGIHPREELLAESPDVLLDDLQQAEPILTKALLDANTDG